MCSSLVRNGQADLQDRSPVTGFVALHIAAVRGHVQCLMVLLDLGAALHPRTLEGDTPRDLALRYGHMHIAEIIDNYPVQAPKTLPRMWLHENLDRKVFFVLLLIFTCCIILRPVYITQNFGTSLT